MNQSLNQISYAIEENRENSYFIERQLPLLTHFAVVEGMHQLAVTDELSENILKFDKDKIMELTMYQRQSKNAPPKVQNLKFKLE